MEKRLFDAFNDLFEANLSNTVSREDSFEKAKDQFIKNFGWQGYRSYESFKVCRSRRRRR
jgi:hypothetical protein